ncbi:MAG: hypothetical protein KIS92_12895, partial [Planctomycetota bacterium]|nr:hypothetical protein [Planctomycetota bacterium]
MEIFYCDSCGKRASADDKQQSLALSPDRIFCKECLAKQAPTKTEPVVKAISSSTAKMIAGTASTPARRPKSDSPNRVATARGKEEHAPAQKNNLPVFLIGGMLVTFALVLVILSSQGSKKPPSTTASNASSSSSSTPTPDPAPAKPAPLPVKPAPSSSSGAVERPVPVVAPAETKTRELTPKEIFEQKSREEKLNPAKPPDLPAAQGAKANLLAIATPPADDPSWKKLFNGADMTGWEMPKGSWDVVEGKMRCTPNPERGGSIVSNF